MNNEEKELIVKIYILGLSALKSNWNKINRSDMEEGLKLLPELINKLNDKKE